LRRRRRRTPRLRDFTARRNRRFNTIATNENLRVLIVEDRPVDAELMVFALGRAGFHPTWTRVDTEAQYLAALDSSYDVVLCDHALPQFSPLRALELLRDAGLDVPLIVVSGSMNDDHAAAALRLGAADYLLKDRLGRLGPAVRAALERPRQVR
jgi:two-component system cell cycle sensor histidine kinase/response regulator CckA